MTLVDVVAARLGAMRGHYPNASNDAWAVLVCDAIRKHADSGIDGRLEVAALAGIATLPKQVTSSGRLQKVLSEQILVTARDKPKGKR